ncbi:MAG: HEAT repeat domain-containing protein, partial [Planctomycetota bacterium]|nr:HEAT repeat domain-containing protein [Planctomycetota bacterium]
MSESRTRTGVAPTGLRTARRPLSCAAACLLALAFLLLLPASARAANQRVLGPQVGFENSDAAICLGIAFSERLAECKSVDVIRASRAVRIANWLRGGAFDRTEREIWQELSKYVSVDAIVDVGDESAGVKGTPTATPKLMVRTANGLTVVALEGVDVKTFYADLPGSTSKLIAAGFKAMGLPEEDQKRGAEVRIKESDAFRYYYVTQEAYAPWPANPYTNAMKMLPASHDEHPVWALDVATLKVMGGYLRAYGTSRDGKEPRQALAFARGALLRVLGTENESAAEALMKLPRNPKLAFALDEMEAQLLGIAQPLVYGKKIPATGKAEAEDDAPAVPGAEPKPAPAPAPAKTPPASAKHAPGAKPAAKPKAPVQAGEENLDEERVKEIEDIAEMTKDRDGPPVEVVEKPSEIGAVVGKTNFTAAESAGALRLLGMMGSEKAMLLIAQAARRDDPMVREAAATALAEYPEAVGMPRLEALGGDADAKVAFTAGRGLMRRQHPREDLRQRAEAMLDKPEPHRGQAAHLLLAMLSTKAGVNDAKPAAKAPRGAKAKPAAPAPAPTPTPAAVEKPTDGEPALDAKDLALLARLSTDVDPVVRAQARALTPPPTGDDAKWLTSALVDAEGEVVLAALKRVGPKPAGEIYARLVTLANDPDNDLAWAAREALEPARPTEARPAVQFEMATAAPYLRQKMVERLRKSAEPWAREEILLACANAEPHTRIAALHAMAELDPAQARGPLLKAIDDPHRLVRLE